MTTTTAPALHLDTDPWLPVTRTDGTTDTVSLTTLFTDAHLIADINTQTPPGYAALLRILTAITYRVTALDDPTLPVSEWHNQRTPLVEVGHFNSKMVTAYFTRWHHRFDLFDADRPWRQDPRLSTECPETVGMNRIIISRPAGSNPAFFSPFHDQDPGTATVEETVENMLVEQFYGGVGTCSARNTDLTRKHNTPIVGPLRNRVSYHPVGPTIFDTLIAHLVPPAVFPNAQPATDLADWETPNLSTSDGTKPHPTGLISLLANDHAHAFLLNPDTSADGAVSIVSAYRTWRYADKTVGNLVGYDPYLSYKPVLKEPPMPQYSQLGRDLWRDIPALLANPAAPATGGFAPPTVMMGVRGLPDPILTTLRIRAVTFATDNTQDKYPTDWSTSTTPPIFVALALNQDDPTAKMYPAAIAEWVNAADAALKRLRDSLRDTYLDARGGNPKADAVWVWANLATTIFWQHARHQFYTVFLEAGSGAEFATVAADIDTHLNSLAVTCYDTVTRGVTDPRGLWSIAKFRPAQTGADLSVRPVTIISHHNPNAGD